MPRLGALGRGFAQVLTGGVLAQVVTVASLPLLSRIYTPAEFGYYALVLAGAGLIAPAATLRFETAAMLPESVEAVRALVWNALLATAIVSLLTAGILGIAAGVGFETVAAHPWLPVWVAVSVLFSAVFALLSQLCLRTQQYRLVGRRALLRSVGTALTQLGLGVAGRTGDGLVVGGVVGSAVGITTMYRRTRGFLVFPGWRSIRGVWREYWRFPAIFAPSALLNSAGLQAPVIFFTLWFGISSGGQLGMAERIVGLPLALIGIAVSQVVDADVSRRIRERVGGLRRIYLRLSAALAALGGVVAMTLGALGAVVIPWVLGTQWRDAGQMVQVLALTAGVRLVASPLSRFVVLLQKGLANTILDIFRVALMVGGMAAVAVLDLDLVAALWVVYLGLAITYAVTWVYGLVVVIRHEGSV